MHHGYLAIPLLAKMALRSVSCVGFREWLMCVRFWRCSFAAFYVLLMQFSLVGHDFGLSRYVAPVRKVHQTGKFHRIYAEHSWCSEFMLARSSVQVSWCCPKCQNV